MTSHLRLVLPSCLFPEVPPTKNLYEPFLSPLFATRASQLNLPDLVTRKILGENYEWDLLGEG